MLFSLVLLAVTATVSALPGSPPGYKTTKASTPPGYHTTTKTTSTPHHTTTTKKTTTMKTTKTKSTSLPIPTQACVVNPLTCEASGFDVNYYANKFGGYGYSDPQSGLGPGYYISEKLPSLAKSTSNEAHYPENQDPTDDPIIYPDTPFDNGEAPYYVGWKRKTSGITVNANNFTLVYDGLYHATSTGTYTICAAADNEVAVFYGHVAFPCGGKAKADAAPTFNSTQFISPGAFPTTCFTEDLTMGFYYPIRLVTANFQGPSTLGFTITAPGGTQTYDLTGKIFPAKCAEMEAIVGLGGGL